MRPASADPEPPALPDGEERDALVRAEHPTAPTRSEPGAARVGAPIPEQPTVVAGGEEAQLLTVRLPRHAQPAPLGPRPDLALPHGPQRETDVGELPLGQPVQAIALILLGIDPPLEEDPARRRIDGSSRAMARGEVRGAPRGGGGGA